MTAPAAAAADPPGRLGQAVARGVPLVVLSPHLDDAALSCGALLIHALGRSPVTVLTLFTEAPPPPYTLSARRYLRQVGFPDARTLYRQRRSEDLAALTAIGVDCVHAGLTEAQFRRRPVSGMRRRWARLAPELASVYPVYRWHVVSGRVAPADAGTLRAAGEALARVAGATPGLLLAPLGVGGHVDHVLARTVAELSGARAIYYSDFPYNTRSRPDPAFLARHGLVGQEWTRHLAAKSDLVRAYRSQAPAMFPADLIPLAPEEYYFPPPAGRAASRSGT